MMTDALPNKRLWPALLQTATSTSHRPRTHQYIGQQCRAPIMTRCQTLWRNHRSISMISPAIIARRSVSRSSRSAPIVVARFECGPTTSPMPRLPPFLFFLGRMAIGACGHLPNRHVQAFVCHTHTRARARQMAISCRAHKPRTVISGSILHR